MSLVEPLELNVKALQNFRHLFPRGEKGRFATGPRSYEGLLDDPLVKDWIDGYTSKETREKKLYQLEKVLRGGGLQSTGELLKLSDRDIKTLVRRIVNWYLQKGKGVWAKQTAITMRGFLEAHDRRLDFKRSERIRTPARKKVSIEHVPSKAEVYRMADNAGSPRNKAILLCLFQSGVRVSCLCNWTYSLVSEQLNRKPPVRIRVTPGLDTKLSLYGLSYYMTGLKEEAVESLRKYLEDRNAVENLKPSDAMFVQEGTQAGDGKVNRLQVWRLVKSSARRARLDPKSVWVHCLRKSFRKVLNATPKIDEDTKEALMGHKLPGSRGSYFDYHDEDEVMSKYMQADFSDPRSLPGQT